MSKLTFLTGITGFVGSAVARVLLAKGHQLRVLCRPNSNRSNLMGLDVEVIEGDLTQPLSYSKSLKGCQNLFHVAADYRLWVPDPIIMHDINVKGTRNLMQAALAAGIERVIYTSSVATLAKQTQLDIFYENSPVAYGDMIGTYKRSKFLAEQDVKDMIKEEHLPAIIVNPSTPIGPRDIKPTPTGRIIIDALSGRMPAYIDTGLNVVHVDDVAMGHWLAFEHGKIGESYILGGDNLTLSQILNIIASIDGPPASTIKLSCNVLYPVAVAMELFAGLTGKEPRITLDALRMAKHKMFYCSAKAEQEIGYSARSAQQALADSIAWFQAEDYINQKAPVYLN
jgi:dihydroflavonol-4-reductase